MKKIIIGTLALIALSITAFAGGNKADKKLLNDLAMTLKNSTHVERSSISGYDKSTFNFNGKTTSVYYDQADGELMGFCIRITESELPQAALEAMKKKYSGWKLADAIMFIDKYANVKFYTQVKKGEKNIALELTLNGRVSFYQTMLPE
jgi:hypothetical protein